MATILLADDNSELRSVYAPVLRAQGHIVYEAVDGLQAVALAQQVRPDLLLLDVWMPGLNGFEVLESLRSDPAATRMRVAILSVLGDADSQLEAFGAGAVEYLVKGMGLDEFLKQIEATLSCATVEATDDLSSDQADEPGRSLHDR